MGSDIRSELLGNICPGQSSIAPALRASSFLQVSRKIGCPKMPYTSGFVPSSLKLICRPLLRSARNLWVGAHEVWKVATSLLLRRNCAGHQDLKDPLSLPSPPPSEISPTATGMDTFFIGHVVVAQQVV